MPCLNVLDVERRVDGVDGLAQRRNDRRLLLPEFVQVDGKQDECGRPEVAPQPLKNEKSNRSVEHSNIQMRNDDSKALMKSSRVKSGPLNLNLT